MKFKWTLVRKYHSVAIAAIISSSCTVAQQALISKENLPKVIEGLYRADQETAKIKPADSAAVAFQRIIRKNFLTVSGIFKKFGYPGYNLVGKEISNEYFTLVQHSDLNLPFQQEVLKQMKKQIKKRNASGQNFAYLTDRIEINSGRPQIYGTQVLMSGNTVIKSCVDTLNLDKRRQSVGLGTIKEYLIKCNEVFYQMNPHKKPGNKD